MLNYETLTMMKMSMMLSSLLAHACVVVWFFLSLTNVLELEVLFYEKMYCNLRCCL